ncbi:MAG: hypothetical protein IT328_21000 [Caldilineaceae bacterium]|nr:hypothetical protein [Caldilineaceae bacterium]
MTPSNARVPRLGLWLLLLGCLFACAPTTYPGYWQSQEGFVPVFNATHSGSIASLATMPDLWRGTGRGAFLLAQSLMVLGATPVAAVRATFALALLLGGLGVYVWLHPRLGDRTAGLAGLVYLLLPPILATVYVRGSVADALIVGLLPLALAGIASYAEGHSLTAAAVVVLSVLWMWRSQPGLALFATLLLIVYAATVERSRLGVLVAAVSGVAGLASLLPLWSIQTASPVDFSRHFLNVAQFFVSGWQPFSTINTWQNEPFQLGFAALAFSVLGVWLWTRRVGNQRDGMTQRLLRFSWTGIGIVLLLSLTIAAPLWSLTGAGRLLTYPWQLLLLACPLLAVTAGSLPALNPHLQRAPLWLTLVGLVMLSSYPYLSADYTQVTPPAAPVATFGQHPDLVLLEANLSEDKAAGEATLDVTWQVLQPLPFDYSIFFQAVRPEDDGWQVVAQLDTQPRQGLEPATSWLPGKIMTDTYQLELPSPLPQGELRYFYGYYDWRDGTRLPVDGGIDDKLILYGD